MGSRRFALEAPAPFRLDLTVWALRRRPHNLVDRFDGTWYRRTSTLGGDVVEVAVQQLDGARQPRLAVELRAPGVDLDPSHEEGARRLLIRALGLDIDLRGFYELASRDGWLATLATRFRGMRPPRFPSVFEAVVNAVACQQLSLTVGIHLLNRLADRYGPRPPGPSDPAGFPRPEQLAGADVAELRALGFSLSKAGTIRRVAEQVASGELHLEALEVLDDRRARDVLLGIRGVGRWSAEYALLRGVGRLEVLPGDDVGARNNLVRRFGFAPSSGYEELSALARAWSPYGGLVYFHLLLDALADSGHLSPGPQPPRSSAASGRTPLPAHR